MHEKSHFILYEAIEMDVIFCLKHFPLFPHGKVICVVLCVHLRKHRTVRPTREIHTSSNNVGSQVTQQLVPIKCNQMSE